MLLCRREPIWAQGCIPFLVDLVHLWQLNVLQWIRAHARFHKYFRRLVINMLVHLWTMMTSNQLKAAHSDHKIRTMGRNIWSWKLKSQALRIFGDENNQNIRLWDNLDSGRKMRVCVLVYVPVGLPGGWKWLYSLYLFGTFALDPSSAYNILHL